MAYFQLPVTLLFLGQLFLIPTHPLRAQSRQVHSEDQSPTGFDGFEFSDSQFMLDLKNVTLKHLTVSCTGKVVAWTSEGKRFSVIRLPEQVQADHLPLDLVPLTIALSPDGSRCALGYPEAIEIMDLSSRKREHRIKVSLPAGDILKFTPDGNVWKTSPFSNSFLSFPSKDTILLDNLETLLFGEYFPLTCKQIPDLFLINPFEIKSQFSRFAITAEPSILIYTAASIPTIIKSVKEFRICL